MNANGRYILDKRGRPIREPDLTKWATWFEKSGKSRCVGCTHIGDATVSTVFLGLDHSFGGGGLPVLWETIIFGEKASNYSVYRRYCSGTWKDAEAMHKETVKFVKSTKPKK